MKFLHTSDLHIGKRLYDASLLDDQRYILKEIIKIAVEEKVDAILISGDVYDKPIPQADAVTVFDNFVTSLADEKIKVFMISGNHDSAQRLDFMSSMLKKEDIYFCGSYKGYLEKVTLTDDYGNLNVYMLPFIKPSSVRQFDENAEITSYESAVKYVFDHTEINENECNIVLSHQFITGASVDDSEELIVGGLDNISADIYSKFDYVALGHIHGRQKIGKGNVIYSGTPLKYSFSEACHDKSVTIVEFKNSNDLVISTRPLKPLHEMRKIEGKFEELMLLDDSEDYIKVVLTDENDVIDAMLKLRTKFPNALTLEYNNTRTKQYNNIIKESVKSIGTPIEMFEKLYEKQMNQPLSDEQRKIVVSLIKKIWGGEDVCDL